MDAQATTSEAAENIDGFEPARRRLLDAALIEAAFDGWNGAMMDKAARTAGLEPGVAAAAFPGGVRDLLRYWSIRTDEAMTEAMAGPDFAALKIREKVAFAVNARLDVLRPHKEAARRAAALLALPTSGLLGAQLAWKTADAVWRGLGDTSTDFNFYSKRGILTGVWTSTMARWLADDSDDEAATQDFLAARIANVMEIEKAKAQIRKLGLDPAAPIRALAKMRYPQG